jgi:methionyl-tRNA formyltransferase
MRIVFMGTPDLGAKALEALSGRHFVAAAVTQPDKPRGRGNKLSPSPVKELALSLGIPILQPAKIKSPENLEILRGFSPDVIVVAAYGQILPKSILELPKHGCVNVHASLLPKYRGAAPVNWAIINGEPETGVTIMQMDPGMDTGDILLSKKTRTLPQDTAGSLMSRLADLGALALLEALRLIEEGRIQRTPQDHLMSTYAPMITKETGRIDWSKTSREIANLVRGLSPSPGAYAVYESAPLKIWEAEAVEEGLPENKNFSAGEIMSCGKQGLLVTTGDCALLVKRVQTGGSKAMPAADYLRGRPMREGSVFS